MPELQIIALTPAVFTVPQRVCAIAVAAARAGAIGILDIEGKLKQFDLIAALSILHEAGGTGKTGIKCGIDQAPLVADAVCAVPGGQLQYVVLSMSEDGDDRLPGAISSLKEFGLNVFVEVVNVDQAKRAQASGADAIIGKGNESPGRVGEETAFVLLQRLRESVGLPVWIRGGVGTHTIAACAVGGAHGVVLDGQLLLAKESPLSAKQRAQLSRMDGSESSAWGQLWGQSGAFASTLAQSGCTVSGIIEELRRCLSLHLEQAAAQEILSAKSPLAQSHGTRYPVLQGAMTRVSDTAEFANCVAQGGALPFLALALMRKPQVEQLLSECKDKLKDSSWGVGILGFVPEPLWHEQMEAVLNSKPPYALIAGGRPDQSKMLEQAGIKTYLHVPSPLLLSAFIDEGARRFVFEGRECGGHVGPRSSFVLWQLMIDVLLQKVSSKEDAASYHIVFAGGIHDSISAAMTAAMAAPLAAAGMRVGLLMGTAYLYTKEAVNSGAIVETFQRKAIECSSTALLETGPGHSIRVIDSPYRRTFEALRARLQKENKNWQEIREELELMNLGRLRVASKGVMRAAESDAAAEAVESVGDVKPDTVSKRYAELSAQVEPKKLLQVSNDQQWQDGMYMIGQVAALHDKILTIEKLHEDVCKNGQQHLQNMLQQVALKPAAEMISDIISEEPRSEKSKPAVAIVGMSCMLPQANDVEKFWLNILNRVNSIVEVPEKFWDWKKLYNPDPLAPDKIVSKWGGFLDAIEFDPTAYGIPPSSMSSVDPMQLLILEAARRALVDAGYEERNFPRSRTSVILANAGHGPVTALYSLRSMLDWKLSGLPAEQRKRLEEILPEWTEDSFPGTLGNVTAGRVSNRFDLGGLNFAVDAACASSLAALYVGVNDLRNGGSDVVLLAATDTHNQPGDYLSFSKTHALSPDGRCKTFDATANGIAISEGIAVLVLKRLADAEAAGDTVYALIKGVGGSSDGRALSLTAPRPAGQVLALKRAYEDSGVLPSSVSLIEAHGTGTVAGDRAEIEALSSMFSVSGAGKQSCAVGSVKSNIGHTKCTAGLASIIKVAKALHHKVLPPTIGVKTPNTSCDFYEGPFYINSESRPWFAPLDGQPRRAGVSAFGFGGTNFHAVLEEYASEQHISNAPGNSPGNSPGAGMCLPSELFMFRANASNALKKQVAHFESEVHSQLNLAGNRIDESSLLSLFAFRLFLRDTERNSKESANEQYRGVTLAIVAHSVPDLLKKMKKISAMTEKQIEHGLNDPQGIYLQDTGRTDSNALGSIAFLFPGQGSQRLNMLADISMCFPQVRRTFERADQIYKICATVTPEEAPASRRLSDYIFPCPSFTEQETQIRQQQLMQTSIAQVAIGVADIALNKLLRDFALVPDMLAGHSYGEYAALAAAGVISEEDLVQISVLRGNLMKRYGNGSMAAIAGNATDVIALLGELHESSMTLANYNAPHQCVISGSEEEIEAAITTLRASGYEARKLPVSAAFHNPAMKDVCRKLKVGLEGCNFSGPECPVYSNLTARPHEADRSKIVRNLVEHTVNPVRFMQEIEQMYDDGARVFIEVGPGNVLTNLVGSILAGKPHLAVSTDRPGRNGVTQLQHSLAALAANGVSLNLSPLFENRCLELEAVERLLKKTKETSGNKKSVKYLVNSYSIERINDSKLLPVGGQVDRQISTSTQTVVRTDAVTQLGTSTSGAISSGQSRTRQSSIVNNQSAVHMTETSGNVENVMLQFQHTMAQMTNNFLQAQQNVMLAYLNSISGGNGSIPSSIALPEIPTLTVPVLTEATSRASSASQITETTPASVSETASAVDPAAADLAVTAVEIVPNDSALPALELNAEELIAGLIDIVSERTGYPPEMLEPHLDLEADLGIDSIKRIEILSTFRKMLPAQVVAQLEGSVEKLASTRTLSGIFDWIREASASSGNVPSLTPSASSAVLSNTTLSGPSLVASAASLQIGSEGQITRGIVKVIDLPAPHSKSAPLHEGIVLVYGGSKYRGSLEIIELLQLHGLNAVLIDNKTFEDDARPIAGLIYLGAFTEYEQDTEEMAQFVEVLKSLKNKLPSEGRPFVIALTKLGGTFGFASGEQETLPAEENAYEQAAVAGIIKTLSREWSDVLSRVVDFESTAKLDEIADQLIDEIIDISTPQSLDHYHVEVGYLQGRRLGLQIDPAPLAAQVSGSALTATDRSNNSAIALDSNSVILLTGGARGITAQLAITLARNYKPKLILLGLQPEPEADVFAHLQTARELKAAIMEQIQQTGEAVVLAEVEAQYKNILKNREIRQTLDAIEKTGAAAEYYCVNACDEVAFSGLLDEVYKKYGRIDGVVHGAGIIEDAYLMNKQIESFKRVVNTKVIPAKILAQKIRFDQLQFMFFLSSVVSRTGNIGQSDYVAANEVLNKLAVKLNRAHKARVAALLWGPWNGGMARPELESLFARYGWTMITNEQGSEAFITELVWGNKNDEEVLLVAQIPAVKIPDTQARDAQAREIPVTAQSTVATYDSNGDDNENGNGNGHVDGNGNGHVDGNGHDLDSRLIKAHGARLSNSYALEKDDSSTIVHLTLSTQEDLYLNDHCLDGLPVLPMAMATELLAEAGMVFDEKLRPARLFDLQIPSGVIFDETSKNFVIRLELADNQASSANHVKACLSSVGSKEQAAVARARFTCGISLVDKQQHLPSTMQIPKGIPLSYKQQLFIDTVEDVPVISDAYQKWFFHGPTFQGIQEILAVGVDGIAGTVLGSSPADCLKTSNGEHWLVDPILLDSAMQLAGIWAWKYLDMMVLPTGFRNLTLFSPPTKQVHHVIVRIPQTVSMATASTLGASAFNVPATESGAGDVDAASKLLLDHSELLCDLAIYGPSGEMIMLLEGLSGIGSRSFNRLVEQPKELRK